MICPSCRAQIEDGSNECSYCGYSFIPSYSRLAAGRSSKIDYDLNQRMKDHLERNGHAEAADPPGRDTGFAEPVPDNRRIVAPPPAERRHRTAQPTQQAAATGQPATHPEMPVQPLQVDISSQKQLPRIDSKQQSISQNKGIPQEGAHKPPQRYTIQNPTGVQESNAGQTGQRIDKLAANNQTANPSRMVQKFKNQGGTAQPPIIVGASDIRHKKRNNILERKPGAYYSATVENRAVQKSNLTSRELAEQLVGEVMAKLSQPKKEQAPSTPLEKPDIEQTSAEAPVMHRPQATYGADLFGDITYRKPAPSEKTRPVFGQHNMERQPPVQTADTRQSDDQQPQRPLTTSASGYKKSQPIPAQQEPPKQETYGFGFEAPMDDDKKQIEKSVTVPEGYVRSDEHAYNDEAESMQAGKYASPMLGPEVYQSDIYVSSDGELGDVDEVPSEYSSAIDMDGFYPEGDEGVLDEVPEKYSLDSDIADFYPTGDEIIKSGGTEYTENTAPVRQAGEVSKAFSQPSEEFQTIDEVDIPHPDVFITADGGQMKDIVPDTLAEESISDFGLSDDDGTKASPETLRYDSSASYTQPIPAEDNFSADQFDEVVNSDEAPTQPVARTFFKSPLAEEEKSKKKPVWLLIGILALVLVVAIGYSLNLWISRSYGSFDDMLNAFFGSDTPMVTIVPKEFDGSAVHEVTVKSSVEGDLVIENFNRRVPFVGGVASAVIFDNVWLQEWIRDNPDDASSEVIMTKPLTMYILKANDERIDLEPQSYEVNFPMTKASVEFENDSLQTGNDKFEIYVIVEPGTSELRINGDNMIGAVDSNRLTYVANLVPGANTFEVFVRTQYCRAYTETIVINRTSNAGNPSSPTDGAPTNSPESPGASTAPTDSGSRISPGPDA